MGDFDWPQTTQSQPYLEGYREGRQDGEARGYRRAVEESYPEIWTICSRHRPEDFDSTCDICVN